LGFDDGSSDRGLDLQSKRRRARRHAWRDGLADQPSLKTSKMFDPTGRLSVLSSAVLILDP
jgi:hypothetical protein